MNDWLVSKFSFSKVNCFCQCPRRFWYRYVMRMKEDVSSWLLFGRAAHTGQEECNLHKLRGERLSVTQVLDAAVSQFEEEAKKEGTGGDLTDAFAAEHRIQLEKFEESGERAKIHPVPGTVEGGFQLELMIGDGDGPKIPALVEGFSDVVSQDEYGKKTLIDYKSGGRPPSPREVAGNLQLALEAVGSEAEDFQIVSFTKAGKQKPTTKVSEPIPATNSRREKVLAFFAEGIQSIRNALKSGDFPKCSTQCHWCSREACSFHNLCYPDKQPDLHKWVEVGEIRPSGSLPPAEWRMSLAARKEAERLSNEGEQISQ